MGLMNNGPQPEEDSKSMPTLSVEEIENNLLKDKKKKLNDLMTSSSRMELNHILGPNP